MKTVENDFLRYITKNVPEQMVDALGLYRSGYSEIEDIIRNKPRGEEFSRVHDKLRKKSIMFVSNFLGEYRHLSQSEWFAKGIKELGDFGALLIGATTNSKEPGEENLREEIISTGKCVDLSAATSLTPELLNKIGNRFVDRLPLDYRDYILKTYGWEEGKTIIGLFTVYEIKALFKRCEEAAQEQLRCGVLRSAIDFDDSYDDSKERELYPSKDELLLLSDLYSEVYDAALELYPDEKTKKVKKAIKEELAKALITVPYCGYMDFIVSNKEPYEVGQYESLIPDSIIRASFGKEEQEIKARVTSNNSPEETFKAIRGAAKQLVSPRALSVLLFDTTDEAELDEMSQSSELNGAYSKFATASCLAQKVNRAIFMRDDPENRIYRIEGTYFNRAFVSIATNREANLMRDVLKTTKNLGVSLPKDVANPVRLSAWCDWYDAQDLAINLYLLQGTGTVVEGFVEPRTSLPIIDIYPERMMTFTKRERYYRDITASTIREENRQKTAKKRAEKQTKELKNPVVSGKKQTPQTTKPTE